MSIQTVAPLAYTRDEAAEALRISKAKVDQAIHSGALKAKRIGRDVRISAESLQAYFDAQPDA